MVEWFVIISLWSKKQRRNLILFTEKCPYGSIPMRTKLQRVVFKNNRKDFRFIWVLGKDPY